MDRIEGTAVYRKLALLMCVYLLLGIALPVLLMLRTSHADAAHAPRATHTQANGLRSDAPATQVESVRSY